MKKLNIIILFIILTITFNGCLKLNLFDDKKPNNFYYTNLLSKDLVSNSDLKCVILDTSFYKEKQLSTNDINVIKNFFGSMKENNFINKPKDLSNKPPYKIFFTLYKNKYVINIYNKRYISIFPWDGKYAMDYIDMNSIPESYNLFNLCKYMIPR